MPETKDSIKDIYQQRCSILDTKSRPLINLSVFCTGIRGRGGADHYQRTKNNLKHKVNKHYFVYKSGSGTSSSFSIQFCFFQQPKSEANISHGQDVGWTPAGLLELEMVGNNVPFIKELMCNHTQSIHFNWLIPKCVANGYV